MKNTLAKKGFALLGGTAAALLMVTGCSSTVDAGGGAGNEEKVDAALGKNRTCEDVVPAPPTEPSPTISSTIALPEAPPEGKTVALVRNATAQWDFYGKGFEEAAEALGWNLETFIYDTDQAGQLQQAINSEPDYIVGASLQIDAVKTQLAGAKAKGIPFVDSGGERTSDPANLFYSIYGYGNTYTKQLADWNINDSCGTANAVYVAPFSLPYFTTQGEVLKDHYAEVCEECKFQTLDISLESLGAGEVPSILASYIQTHPDVNYVMFGFDSVAPGVGAALDNAGLLDNVKLTGVGATGPQLKEMIQGVQSAWTASPADSYGWGTLDILARLAVDEDPMPTIEENNAAGHGSPTWVIDDVKYAEELVDLPFGWPGAEGYRDQYKTLWQVN